MPSQSAEGMTFRPDLLSDQIQRRALTNLEAAHLIGVTEKTVWRWRRGVGEPRLKHIRRMAAAFDCDPMEFFGPDQEQAA